MHEAATEGAMATPDPAPRPVTAQRLTLGQSRRLGLGAPLPTRHAVPVQRSVDAAPLDLAPLARAPRAGDVETSAEKTAPIPATGDDEPVAPLGEAIAPLAGSMVQRQVGFAAGDGEPHAALPLARPAAASREVATPVANYPVQRVVATPMPSLFPRPAPTSTVPLAPERAPLLTTRRGGGSLDAGGDAGLDVAEPLPVQRLAAIPHADSPLSTRELDLYTQHQPPAYREVVSSPPMLPAPALPRSAALAPAVQRVTPEVQDFVAYSTFAMPPMAHAAQRSGSVIDAVPVQREVAAGEAPAPEPVAASAPAAGAGPAGGEGPAQSEKELDDLARKLHDRISLHLRRDLLIQRERAGMAIDLE